MILAAVAVVRDVQQRRRANDGTSSSLTVNAVMLLALTGPVSLMAERASTIISYVTCIEGPPRLVAGEHHSRETSCCFAVGQCPGSVTRLPGGRPWAARATRARHGSPVHQERGGFAARDPGPSRSLWSIVSIGPTHTESLIRA